MPSKPGIYIYKNTAGQVIYVGKAKSLINRVRSYFQPPTRLGPKTAALVSQIASIDHIEVLSEIEALLLESKLIKKFKPQYNLAAKDDKSPYFICLTRETFPKPVINHDPDSSLAGPFLSGLTARKILRQFRHVAPFCTASRPVKQPCFYSHLGLCRPCPYPGDKFGYQKNISRLRKLLRGQFSQVSSQLKKDMLNNSQALNFETARQLRDKLQALDHLLQIPISPDEYLANPNLVSDLRQSSLDSLLIALSPYIDNLIALNRIEMYDIANISGTSATGAMTVAQSGEISSRLYRHFTVKTKASPDDVAMMSEVLSRRLKRSDWPKADLIVLDGGKSQLSIVKTLSATSANLPPIISLAKREETLVIPTANDFVELQLPFDHPGLKLLQRLRDEAHRFSRRLHHKHRRDSLLK